MDQHLVKEHPSEIHSPRDGDELPSASSKDTIDQLVEAEQGSSMENVEIKPECNLMIYFII